MTSWNIPASAAWGKIGLIAMIAIGGQIIAAPVAQAEQITFQEILDSPDNLQLNLDYARQEVASGRLQQAASALERLVLVQPNWDEARLFYGIVLYRLDDLKGAQRELEILEGRGLSPSQESDRRRYLALSVKQSDPLRITGRITAGGRWDSNPGRVADATAAAAIASRDADEALTGSSQFRLERDIDGAQGSYIFFQGNGYINEYFNVDRADFIATRAKTGITFLGPDFEVSTYALYGRSWLQHETFRQQYGAGVDVRWGLSSTVELLVNGRGVYENYQATSFSTVGNNRDGWRKSVDAGFQFRPSDSQTFRLTGGFARKDADFNGYSYDQSRIDFKSLTLFGAGRYLSLGATYKRTQYDAPDNFYSFTTARDDDYFRGRAAVGAPLETLFRKADFELPEAIADIVAQVGVTYSRQDSSIPSLDISNWSADIMFTKRYSF